jgi:FkbM family methyltransferase
MTAFWHRHVLPRLNSALRRCGYRLDVVDFDYILKSRLLLRGARDFFFLQVGAFDGVSHDPITRYIEQFDLRGVLIEPQPQPFARLAENYRDHRRLTLVNAAVSETEGTRDFFTVRAGVPGMPEWSQQLASFDRNNILKHRDGIPAHGVPRIPDIEQHIEVQPVRCLTFDRLLDDADAKIVDLLQIDAEGYDVELLKSFPFERVRPAIIRYEHMHVDAEAQHACVARLKALGYRVISERSDTYAYLR